MTPSQAAQEKPTSPRTTDPYICNHGYLPHEIPAHHRAEIESVADPIEAIRAVVEAAHGDYDQRNIVIPLREPNGSMRTEWERLKLIAERRAAAATPSLADVHASLMDAMTRIAASKVGEGDEYKRGWIDALGAVSDEFARLDEGSATPDQGKGEPR